MFSVAVALGCALASREERKVARETDVAGQSICVTLSYVWKEEHSLRGH